MRQRTPSSRRSSRRAAIILVALSVGGVLTVGAVGAAVLHFDTAPPITLDGAPPAEATTLSRGDAAMQELATRAMPELPLSAAAPQPLATDPAPQTLRLSPASARLGEIPTGFPPTPEGAVAALVALDETALRGGDPAQYIAGYEQIAAPGAPPAASARLTGLLSSMRTHAGLPVSGPLPGLEVNYRVSQAQIKGVLDHSRFAVVCVLGQLDAAYQGSVSSYGVGDCQALVYVDGDWRISPGPAAARAPDAWPGSVPARDAGYLGVDR